MVDRFRHLDGDRYDLVVVGAGVGGLTAAAIAARRGLKVLVIDRHYRAGGNATLFQRRGYRFDVGVHYMGECGQGGMVRRMLAAAGAGGVGFEELDPDGIDTLHFPDFTFRVPRGAARYRERLLSQFPAERAGIDRYFTAIDELRRTRDLLLTPLPTARVLLRAPLLAKHIDRPFGDFLADCTGDERLRAVLAAQHGDYALPPSRVSLVTALGMTLHYLDGAWFPRGGGQAISDALADAVEAAGGRLVLRARAERILIENRRATGVELSSPHLGRRVVRAGAVLSNADIKHTLLDLVERPALRPATVTRADAWEMAPSLGVLFLGLRLEGQPWLRTNHFVFGGYDHERLYRDLAGDRLPDGLMAFVSNTSAKDPSNTRLAPPGISNVEAVSLAPASPAAWGVTEAQVRDGSYHRSSAYRAAKAHFQDRLLETIERFIPDARARITFAEVATPLTHRRFTGAHSGTSYGIAATTAQSLDGRPGPRTEIANLFLCGASCRTGHGVAGAMASGVMAAAELVGGSLVAEVFVLRVTK